MIDLFKIFLHEDATIEDALNAIDIGAVKIVKRLEFTKISTIKKFQNFKI